MKIQCDECQTADAAVMCCADEAALCAACDVRVHSGNKLAANHQRLPISHASTMPICDVCQEALGFFFCVEDRMVVCRKCDITAHENSTYGSKHRRLLLTGVKVGLHPMAHNQPAPAPAPPDHIAEFSKFEGNGSGSSDWSRILKSVEEILGDNLGEADDVLWTVPESLSTQPALTSSHDTHMEWDQFNKNLGRLARVDDHDNFQHRINPVSSKRSRQGTNPGFNEGGL